MAKQKTVLEVNERETTTKGMQSKEKRDFVSELFGLFTDAKTNRERTYSYFNDLRLVDYIQSNHNLTIGRVPILSQDDWRSNTSTQMVRNKFIDIVASLVSQMIQPEVTAQKSALPEAKKIAAVLQELLIEEASRNDWFKDYLDMILEAVSQGTVFVETGFIRKTRKIKEVLEKNLETGDFKFEEKEIIDFKGLFNNVVPIEEMYLGNMLTHRMEDQPFIFRRQVMDYVQAQQIYGKYTDWELVPIFSGAQEGEDGEPNFIREFDNSGLVVGQVEVITYQSRPDDEMAIIANGILLTKMNTPLPYDHKEYSIVKGMFNPFDVRFAYGKAFPAEEMFNQSIADTLLNMLIDKTYLSIFPPMVVKGRDHVISDVIVPGAITPVDEDSNLETIGNIGQPVNGSEFNMFSLVQSIQQQTSVSQAGTSFTPQGGAISATQTIAQQDEAAQLLGLFGFTIAFLVEDLGRLQLQNILDFLLPGDIDDEETDVIENAFVLEGRQLFGDNRRGTMIVRAVPIENQPEVEEVFREEEEMKIARGENVQIVYLDPEKIRDYDFVVSVQANPQRRKTKSLEKALEFEFFQTFFQNPLVNQERLIRNMLEIFEKDPEEFLVPQQQTTEQAQTGAALAPTAPGPGQTTAQMGAGTRPGLNELLTQ